MIAIPARASARRAIRHVRAMLFAFLAPLVLGCGASASPPPPATSGALEPSTVGLKPGDAVSVQVWREADLSGTFVVDDRGYVTLPLLGELSVEGYGVARLRERLHSDYAAYLRNPSVEVTVLRRLNILGEVRNPGLYSVDATVSVADAIAMAGGITPAGDPRKIQVVRGDESIVQNLGEATTIGTARIQSGDQIVVGQKGWIARNSGVVVGSLIAATAIIAAAFINN
jgi:polysaccharide export outer membrane protein